MENTGRWLEWFLTPSEKEHFAEWKEVVKDRSVINHFADPVFEWLAGFVPENVAPNTLTVAGSLAILQAWYFSRSYADSDARVVSVVSIGSIIAFWVLGGIDGKHARRTMNDTSMGELFKYSCDALASTFLVVVMCSLMLEDDLPTQWYCVQTVQLVFFLKHYSAFVREAGIRYFLIGPGELVSWAAGLIAICAIIGTEWLKVVYSLTWGFCCNSLVARLDLDRKGYLATMSPARATYITVVIIVFLRIVFSKRLRVKHEWTRNCLLLILSLRTMACLFGLAMTNSSALLSERDVILDGLFMGMITSDMIVAKMANREIHSYVVIMAISVVLPHLQFLILCFIVFYYIAVFGDLMNYMNLPLLQVCKNVYCDGVYDLCHVGHKNLFRGALKHGNRLFVGVVGDEDANNYKRPPVMSAAERESEVASCKCVTKVIPNAPCFGMPEDFIRKHRIHVVAMGQEYIDRYPNPDDDPYYKVPRKLGIHKPMPRSEGISTSELIARIQSRCGDDKKSPT